MSTPSRRAPRARRSLRPAADRAGEPRGPTLAAALALLVALAVAPALGATPDDPPVRVGDALPADADHDPALPTPTDVFGWTPGAWHARPEQITDYFQTLAAASPRVELIETGRTHEQRPLLLAVISAPENLARLEELRRAHLERARAGRTAPEDAPLVVWMGYSVHGNESSGANAVSSFAHHLAADRSATTAEWLARTIVLVDPMLNPDGLARFAHWANMHQGTQRVASADHREHREPWPSGRTNHYWFDLNRDWLPLVHPESRARVTQFQRWLPNVLTDFHEMGTDATYFFQPGVPSRGNPNTPERNLELTRELAAFHAAALDAAGELYYSEESFDDYYYGKGSTYPDVNGAVGILFEQASSRGHLQENSTGELSFERTLRNQLLTSLSTLRGAHAHRRALLDWQSAFYAGAARAVTDAGLAGWLFGRENDPARNAALVDTLQRHAIRVHPLTAEHTAADGTRFLPGQAFVVPADQPQARLARALFERPREFADETFYDVSAWTLPLAFGVPAVDLAPGHGVALGEPLPNPHVPSAGGPARDDARTIRTGLPSPPLEPAPAGYALVWGGLHAPRSLAALLRAGVRVRVATRPFTAETTRGPQRLREGTLLVPARQPELDPQALLELVHAQLAENATPVHHLTSGLTPDGVDLGSPSVLPVEPPVIGLLVDGGASSYEAGELWHAIDLGWQYPVRLLESGRVSSGTLAELDVLLAPSGALSGLSSRAADAARAWLREGGTLVALRGSATWAAREWLALTSEDDDASDEEPSADEAPDDTAADDADDTDDAPPPRYADYEAERALGLVSGVFLASRIDPTHPLGFGYRDGTLATFRAGTHRLPTGSDPFAAAAVYTDEPLLAGYGGPRALERLAGSASVLVKRDGAGTLVLLADDPVFRGFTHGSARLLANAVFFGQVVKRTRALDEPEDADATDADAGHEQH